MKPTMPLFVALAFSLHSVTAVACMPESAPLLRNGAPPAGLSYVAVNADTTTFRAGSGDKAVTYSVYPKYLDDTSSGDPGNKTDQDKRFKKSEVCLSLENACGGKSQEVCFKRDALWSDASVNENKSRLAKAGKDCPKILDMVSFLPAGKMRIKAADQSGKNVANVQLQLTDIVTADFRKGSKASKVLEAHSLYDHCLTHTKPSAECKRLSPQQMKVFMAGIEADWLKYREIENRLIQYRLAFTPSAASGNSDSDQRTEIEMASSYYEVQDTSKKLSGDNIEPVEKVANIDDIEDGDVAVFHTAEITAAAPKGKKSVKNTVEYLQKNYEQSRGLSLGGGADHKGFDVGVASSPLTTDGCQLTGGTPKHKKGRGYDQGDKAELIAPVNSGQ